MKKIGFFSAFIIPSLVVAGFYSGGWWNFSSLAFVFIVVPVIDQIAGLDKSNVPVEEKSVVGEEFYYRFVTYIWVYVQFAFFLWAAYAIATTGPLTTIEWTGFTIGFALVTGGIGITVAHELGHKKSKLEQVYSQALLMTVCYMHFFIEHNRGHHVHVATPEDPATAKEDQSFYSFWFQTVFGSWHHAWKIEAESLKRKQYATVSFRNPIIWYMVLPIIFCAWLMAIAGFTAEKIVWQIPIFFFSQSVLAFSLLELVNYIEHYGIIRREITPGRYEQVNPLHSWNASHLISNFFLFQLQRHSDHHFNASRRYQALDHYDESPQLPFGYPTMIMIALLPPLWFNMMNKRLAEWRKFAYV